MRSIEKHFSKLGCTATDKVTGFSGVVTTLSFDLYGCVQVILTPPAKDAVVPESRWFDIERLNIVGGPVMEAPDFFGDSKQAAGLQGASEKPLPQ